MKTLSHAEARRFYDRFGARQDKQSFYEDAALDVLVEHARFGEAQAVVEFGCGTGRLAERLLEGPLAGNATYRGFDISATMIELTRSRLERFAERAEVIQTGGEMRLPLPDDCADRLVSTYVLDIFSDRDLRAFVAEAARVVRPGGLLCVTSLGHGDSLPSRVVTGIWSFVHRLRPSLVGGCRPLDPTLYFPPPFVLEHRSTVEAWLIPSVVAVGRRSDAGETSPPFESRNQ